MSLRPPSLLQLANGADIGRTCAITLASEDTEQENTFGCECEMIEEVIYRPVGQRCIRHIYV